MRTSYDTANKRARTVVVGRVPKGSFSVPESLKPLMTEEEIQEATIWLEGEQRTMLLREEIAARTLAGTLADANRWFAKQESLAEHRWIANSILPELQLLRKNINRALG